jgi:hypothetical protein
LKKKEPFTRAGSAITQPSRASISPWATILRSPTNLEVRQDGPSVRPRPGCALDAIRLRQPPIINLT